MLLAVDVGNTQTHVGVFRAEELLEHWRFATVREATADELATVVSGLLGLRGLGLGDVEAAIVSAVVPSLAREYDGLVHHPRQRIRQPCAVGQRKLRGELEQRLEHEAAGGDLGVRQR